MVGPCMCGDPYCMSCGNPSQAAFADAIDAMAERISEKDWDEHDLALFETCGVAAVERAQKFNRGRGRKP